MNNQTRVLLVDDSRDILDLYRRLINAQPDLECVAIMESTVGLEATVRAQRADVAVIDLVGPGRDAFEAMRSTAAACPGCRMIAFSGHDDLDTLDRAAEAGAWSMVSKNADPMRLVEEIRRAGGQRA